MNVSPTDATVCLSIVHLYRHTWAMVTVWRSANGIGRINEVTLRGARLVLGWVTVFGRAYTTSVCNLQPPRLALAYI